MKKNTATRSLSQRMVNHIQPGQWISENLCYGHGSLQVRGTPTGGRYYLRIGGGRERIPLGVVKGKGCLTLDEARQRDWQASVVNSSGVVRRKTLGDLLTAYCETLFLQGKSSQQVLGRCCSDICAIHIPDCGRSPPDRSPLSSLLECLTDW